MTVRRGRRRGALPTLERLDERVVLSTFTVANLGDAGAGSLRQAILDANANAGSDLIQFTVAGTIGLTSAALPEITDPVNLDGTTAPGFAGSPVVEVDANGFDGLRFGAGSTGSALRSLGVVESGADGVRLDAGGITVVGNYLGIRLDGQTADGNAGDGLSIRSTSANNTVGATTTVGTSVLSKASNLISGNAGSGITVQGSSGNRIVANYIGTDVTGTKDVGNVGDGVRLSGASSNNTLGGNILFVNTTNQVPLGNLISGNGGAGVRITSGASKNVLSANFVGTDVTGNAPLGNDGDGVAILDGSDNNALIGTVQGLSPFVYANIVSGNKGNGLVIRDSDNTTVQANFFGLGYNNKTPVGNALDGTLIGGDSKGTVYGGVIPLGNVSAANGRHGVEVADTSSGLTAFNTFAGIAAFQTYTNLGNGLDGFYVTSTGGDNLIRTNVISSNRGHGVEIGGDAHGVELIDNIIGMNTGGQFAMPNGGDGVRLTGNASHNLIGATLRTFSVIPRNAISGNLGHGVSIVERAHDNRVLNSVIGTNLGADAAVPNGGSGVFVAGDAISNIIGSDSPDVRNVISGNIGHGVVFAAGTGGNVVAGNFIGTDNTGLAPLPNGGSGVYVADGTYNLIGGTIGTTRNVIAFNYGAGVFVGVGSGNTILGNSIFANGGPGIVIRPGANGGALATNAPVLTSLRVTRTQTTIGGTLRGVPGDYYAVQFFANTSPAPPTASGQVFLGSTVVRIGSNGTSSFSFVTPTEGAGGYTTTATSLAGNSSPFSNSVPGSSRLYFHWR